GSILVLVNTNEGSINQDSATIDLYTSDLSKAAPGFTSFVTAEGTSSFSGLGWVNKTTLVTASRAPLSANDDKHFRLWAMDVTQPQQHVKAIPIEGSLQSTFGNNNLLQLAVSPDGSQIAIVLFNSIVVGQ